jgi:hypothetical protein
MRYLLKLPVLALGLSLGMAALPIAHSDMDEGMVVLMKDVLNSADPDKMPWKRYNSVPYGMRIVMMYGDPSLPGPFIFRARMVSGYRLPPHRHPDERNVTVLKGTYWSGTGEKFDRMAMTEFPVGSMYVTKANVPHFAWAQTEVVIQEMGTGPDAGITYVNPDDDPRPR